MTTTVRVADYMSRDVVRLRPDMEILAAMQLLLERRISGAPVVDGAGALVGMLSKKDCLRAALHASYHRDWGGEVAGFMSRDVVSLPPDMDIVAAAQRFVDGPYRRFPVLSEGRLVGQISRADVLRALAESWDAI